MNIAKASQLAYNRKSAQDIVARVPNKEQDSRCTSAVARLVLLSGRICRNGDKLEPKTKSLGCGVYHIWYQPI
jgi:hypothetical protein